jgi:hypothetical protein
LSYTRAGATLADAAAHFKMKLATLPRLKLTEAPKQQFHINDKFLQLMLE